MPGRRFTRSADVPTPRARSDGPGSPEVQSKGNLAARMDRVANFLGEKTPRRALALASFLVVLYLFRSLAILLVFFVAFQRSISWASGTLAARAGLPRKKAIFAVLGAMLAGIGAMAWLGIDKSIQTYTSLQETMPERLADLRENPLVRRLEEHVSGSTETILESAKHYSGNALSAASAIGHFFIHVLVAFILALVFVLEEEELRTFWARVEHRSLGGTIGRWLGHVADALVVTVQLQLVVGAFNTVTTLPVLLVLGVPHVGGLMVLIFVSALVPVIGNIVSGVVLSLLAYQAKGWLGVGIFVGLTFLLHKIESYYLSPRLTARHVKIPGFLLIVSLLLCEHLFGFAGFFLSFPILFVAGRIRSEWLEEDAVITASPIVLSDRQDQLPTKDVAPLSSPTGFELERDAVSLEGAHAED